jgi:hypothetical protein
MLVSIAITEPKRSSRSGAKCLQYSDIFFAQVGIFYPFAPFLFLLFLLPNDALCGKGTLNTG